MKLLAIVFVIACSKSNDVRLLLGPTEDTLSRGFLCKSETTGQFLMLDALTADRKALELNLVVDVLELQNVFPGCRGEELLSLCDADPKSCKTSLTRFCTGVRVDVTGLDANNPDPKALVTQLRKALPVGTILPDLPDGPVIIRVVAMKPGPCLTASDALVGADAYGCAYSCPVQLDQVSGSIAVSLDTLNFQCEPAVRACASFPPPPSN